MRSTSHDRADQDGEASQVTAPRASGLWVTANRSTPTSRTRRTTTRSTCGRASRTSTPRQGFDSIDKSDLRGRFRWWGLYTQRKPGYDGTWTGDENTDMLEDEFFMLRVRSDGGALTAAALRTLGGISTEFARDTADISDRENVQYHWIRVEDMPEIWRRLDAVGLQTTEACGDCPRVVLGSPLAGESVDEILDGTPGDRRDRPPLRRQAGVLQPAAQVQDRDQRPAGRGARGQRRRVHRGRPPRARPRFRPVGGRRAVDQPDAGASGSVPGFRSTRCPTSGKRWSACSATTATGGCARRPG